MKANKSPGLDGLTVEFYNKFWHLIGQLVVNSLNTGFLREELSYTQKQSIFSLIFKKGDADNLENWRPISLLNTDYKIAAKILSNRLQSVLPHIISQDQQGYIKNRNISFNIRQIQDVIDFINTSEMKNEGIILFLDFKKAFDTVKWPFMISTLEKFGFKENFIKWIKTLYKNANACIANNGWISDHFYISQGVRQDAPSPLFCLLWLQR